MMGARWQSSGRRLLIAALGAPNVTATSLAIACRVRSATISALACGTNRRPSIELAFALQDHAGIDARSWLDARLEICIGGDVLNSD